MPTHLLLLLAACSPERTPGDSSNPSLPTNGATDDPPAGPPGELIDASATTSSMSQADLALTLDGPANVAVACTRRDEPEEVHLVEGAGDGDLTLPLAGLLHGTDYDCAANTVDPAGTPRTFSFRTPEAVGELAEADAITDPALDMTGAYTVMNVRPECFGGSTTNYLTILGPEGESRWRYDLPRGMNIGVEVRADGPDRLLWGGGQAPVGRPEVVDIHTGPVWNVSFPGSEDVIFHHDGHRIADGRILSVEQTEDLGWEAFRLRLIDEAGTTSWTWDAEDAISQGWLEAGDATNTDPHHLNWADVVQTDDGLVAYGSLCYAFLIFAVDVDSGQKLWKFGRGGDFTLRDENGAVLPDDEYPECQHGLQTDGTHLLVYDNGLERGYTRASEFALDLATMTATRTWLWEDETRFWEMYHGGVDWLDDAHERVLVAEGNNDCGDVSDRPSQIAEVDRPSNKVVHRLVMRDVGHWIYRAHRLDGCEVFSNTRYCPALADRLDALRPALGLDPE
jgi:hypothetical protein